MTGDDEHPADEGPDTIPDASLERPIGTFQGYARARVLRLQAARSDAYRNLGAVGISYSWANFLKAEGLRDLRQAAALDELMTVGRGRWSKREDRVSAEHVCRLVEGLIRIEADLDRLRARVRASQER